MPRLQKEPSPAQVAAREAGAARLRAVNEKRTQPVRSRRLDTDTMDHKVGQDHPRDMPAEGPARLDPPLVQPVDQPLNLEKAELLKFMEDVLIVNIHDSTNPTDDPTPMVWNDGVSMLLIRGKEQPVKRKFVEILARMKRVTFTQERLPNNEGYRNVPHSALLVPFAVVSDPNVRGGAWLKAILAEG
ncbi:MAG: hypothetical protein A3E01_08230 [Gammaproteobacteria bacterium RIFCSPHIGHO2_12_FULL_63_22]|nr:MAG: hypothetical protein A3E01_08230 [Gammaproteobacteria bacterium RIFCSPHIGHO2_12_FULL_63_22]